MLSRRSLLRGVASATATAAVALVPLAVAAEPERLVRITGQEWLCMGTELRRHFERVKHGPINIDAAWFRWVENPPDFLSLEEGKARGMIPGYSMLNGWEWDEAANRWRWALNA